MSKKPDAKKGGGAAPETNPEIDPALVHNLDRALAILGVPKPPSLDEALNPPQDPAAAEPRPYTPGEQIVVREGIRSPHVRALCAALLARGEGMKKPAYSPLKRLLLLATEAGDSGAAAVAEVLRDGGQEGIGVKLELVSLLGNDIGVPGCVALGNALTLGANDSLQTLVLDCNPFGDEGVQALVRGLRMNRILKRLSLAGVGMGAEGAEALAQLLSSPLQVLEALDVSGNEIGGAGLLHVAGAVRGSPKLKELALSNCGIRGGLPAFGRYPAMEDRKAKVIADALALAQLIKTGGKPPKAAPAAPPPARPAEGAAAGGGGDASPEPPPLGPPSFSWEELLHELGPAGSADSGAQALVALGEALRQAPEVCALESVDLDGNPLSAGDGEALCAACRTSGVKVKKLLVPSSLPALLFAATYRFPAPPKKRAPKKK